MSGDPDVFAKEFVAGVMKDSYKNAATITRSLADQFTTGAISPKPPEDVLRMLAVIFDAMAERLENDE